MSDTAAIQSRHYPEDWGPYEGGVRCGGCDTSWPCDARQEGDRADANADLAEAAQDELRALTLRADAAERERDSLLLFRDDVIAILDRLSGSRP